MKTIDYWEECISQAAEECGVDLTADQLLRLAGAAQNGHENYSLAFYEPPNSERADDIEKEWKGKLKAQKTEFEQFKANAEKAIGKALRQDFDANISIGEHGEVFRHGGRTTQIQ